MSVRRDDETLPAPGSQEPLEGTSDAVPTLTILAHPDPNRVGEILPLPILNAGGEVSLARMSPNFRPLRRGLSLPLADRSVSRQPFLLRGGREPGEIVLDPAGRKASIDANGEPIEGQRIFSAEEIDRGVVLQVGWQVALLLHFRRFEPLDTGSEMGLVGESRGIIQVREEIRRLGALNLPVLIRGETGTGKELVARALHHASSRRDGPFVVVNMATILPSLAAAELFGAVRGAFTGADRDKVGFFQHAHGGTLFLDEIGETPPEVQPMLLRALENREVLAVGSVEAKRIDVRILAATDLKLGKAIQTGRFRAPLFHRLAGYFIQLPSLAERRDDIGRLFYFFLRQELKEFEDDTIASGRDLIWPPAELVARLARYDWPGNVRELRNLVRWLVISGRHCSARELLKQVEERLDGDCRTVPRPDPEPVPAVPSHVVKRRQLRKPEEINDRELRETLRGHQFKVSATAEALGISRANLYRLIDGNASIRKAADLQPEEIERALALCGGELKSAAFELGVSLRGLKRRMTALQLATR